MKISVTTDSSYHLSVATFSYQSYQKIVLSHNKIIVPRSLIVQFCNNTRRVFSHSGSTKLVARHSNETTEQGVFKVPLKSKGSITNHRINHSTVKHPLVATMKRHLGSYKCKLLRHYEDLI
eukprot:Gb_09674 [translate_table: standard]